MILGVLIFLNLIPSIETVKCIYDSGNIIGEVGNETCEGEFCVAYRTNNAGVRTIRTCVTGAKKPSDDCLLGFEDQMACYCDTDLCNSNLIFRSNFTVLPIVECKAVKLQQYIASACNTCVRSLSYFNALRVDSSQKIREEASCSSDFDIIINGAKEWGNLAVITQGFFSDACYNISFHAEQYAIYCRCSQSNCNTPESVALPYPIAEPTVTCFTSGLDAEYDDNKYAEKGERFYKRLLKNERVCRGHFCLIAVVELRYDGESLYHKGCISANEQGENKIKLGYSFLNSIPYYICNTNFCNSDIQNVLEEARNATVAVRDNGSIHQLTLITTALFSSFLLLLF